MIKCDKGRIEIKGTPMVLVGELGTAIQTVYRAMLNTGIDKVFAEERIKKACELALSMWKVTKKDGSTVEIERDNSLVIYINELNNEADLGEILKIERCEGE